MADPILESWGLQPQDFWDSCTRLQKEQGFDPENSYLYRLVEEGRANESRRLNASSLKSWGASVRLFPDVGELFGELPAFIEIFIVSGGLKPLIEGCLESNGLSSRVSQIFACQMAEEEPGPRLSFPKETVGFTMKTQKLFAISKGSWRPDSTIHVNDKLRDKSFSIPFSAMCYVGDGLSDVAAFATLRKFGGTGFAVHTPDDAFARARAVKLADEDGRANKAFEADYSDGSALRTAIMGWATAD